ncbi:MAG: M20 aminoacylase family protein [Castellaniella sp.]
MRLAEEILAWQAEMTAIRRDFHAHPEIAFEEMRTSDRVADMLQSWGIPVTRGLGGTGVVGTITGRSASGPAIGLRADMDALPMPEVNDFPHASRNPGKMHACGHDGHMTMLLAAARLLAQTRDFDGTVHVIFQPAEEGGHAGARAMIRDGLFSRFPVAAVFGMHNWPGLPVGEFAIQPGPMMASSNTFEIEIEGKGAHAAMPNLGIDPVMAAVQLAQSLQTIITRNCDPLDPAVISITQIHAGSTNNVIPDTASLQGTVRSFSTAVLDLVEARMAEITEHTCRALACSARFNFIRSYPPTVNDAAQTDFCRRVAESLVGPQRVHTDVKPSMGAEDFAFMLQEVPGSYVWVGNGAGEHRDAGHGAGPCTLHNSSYDFNDELIPIGASYWVELARQWLRTHAETEPRT